MPAFVAGRTPVLQGAPLRLVADVGHRMAHARGAFGIVAEYRAAFVMYKVGDFTFAARQWTFVILLP
jgi:hypothetical protein